MITIRLSGGLGNQMFEYAAARALALRNGTEVRLDLAYLLDRTPRPWPFRITFREYELDIFLVAGTIAKKRETPLWFLGMPGTALDMLYRRIFKPRGTERQFQFDPSFLTLPDGTYLDGHWQSPKYFAGYEDVIRADFTFQDEMPDATRMLGDKIAEEESVCVHVRRADFIGSNHEICDKAYYDRGIAELGKRTQIEKIYVFSDDTAWCKKHISFGAISVVVVGEEYAGRKNSGHLYLMQKCRHFVIANSSFSWWAAWLAHHAEKIVIAPRRWFRDERVDSSDIAPPEWIRL